MSALGTLYVVATPIGNFEDVTLRALRVLGEVDTIAAEDTRVTARLLSRHGLRKPMLSYRAPVEGRTLPRVLSALEGGAVALVTDAGTPGVSDPGFPLIRDALSAGHHVVPVPGASSAIAALVASGLPTHAFCFFGFLPRTSATRRKFFSQRASSGETLVVFESPYRVVAALKDLVATLGPERPVAISRELTKRFEEIFRGTASAALEHFEQHPPRGEFTLVIGGHDAPLPGASA